MGCGGARRAKDSAPLLRLHNQRKRSDEVETSSGISEMTIELVPNVFVALRRCPKHVEFFYERAVLRISSVDLFLVD